MRRVISVNAENSWFNVLFFAFDWLKKIYGTVSKSNITFALFISYWDKYRVHLKSHRLMRIAFLLFENR